jgi:hypothetical protein
VTHKEIPVGAIHQLKPSYRNLLYLLLGIVGILALMVPQLVRANSDAVLSTNALNFGLQNVGTTSAAQTVTITLVQNAAGTFNGSVNFNVSLGTGTDFAFNSSDCGDSFSSGSCNVLVTFTPTQSGIRTDTLTIQAWDRFETSRSFTVRLTGNIPPPDPTGRVYGKVTLKNQQIPVNSGVTVNLTGTAFDNSKVNLGPQQLDASGNYGFNGVKRGKYTVVVNPTQGWSVTGASSVDVDFSKIAQDTQVNFNLTDQPAPTPTSGGGNGPSIPCEQAVPTVPSVVDIVICRQATGSGRVFTHIVLRNSLNEAVNVRNSVKLGLAAGASIADSTATAGVFNGQVWNGFDLPAGGSALLELTVDTTSGGIFNSVNATVTGISTNKLFGATIAGFNSSSALNRTSLQFIPSPAIPNCGQVVPNKVLEFVTCIADVVIKPDGTVQFIVKVIVLNGLNNKVDVGKTVEVDIDRSVTLVSATSDTGATRTESDNTRVVWSGYTVDSGKSASLTLTLESSPQSANQNSIGLITNIRLTAVDAINGSKYEGNSGAYSSTSGLLRTPVQTQPSVPSKLPITGANSGDKIHYEPLAALATAILGATLLFWRYRKRANH